MTTEKLIEKTSFIFSDRDALKNIYARILHGLSPSIRHELDTLRLQPGCKWHFKPHIYGLIPTFHPQEHRADDLPGIQILDSSGEQFFDNRLDLCRRDFVSE